MDRCRRKLENKARTESGRSWITRKRWVTFSRRMTDELIDICNSDVEDEIILMLTKQKVAQIQGNKAANERSQNRLRFWQHAVVHRQAKTVDYVDDWIQLEKPLVAGRQHIEGKDDRSEVKPR